MDTETFDGLDLPGEEFDYDEFIKEEFESGSSASRLRPIWWVTALVLLIVFASWLVFSFL